MLVTQLAQLLAARVPLDPVVGSALEALRAGRVGATREREAVGDVAQACEAADPAVGSDGLQRARVALGLWFAFQDDPYEAVLETAFEAYWAGVDVQTLQAAVGRAAQQGRADR